MRVLLVILLSSCLLAGPAAAGPRQAVAATLDAFHAAAARADLDKYLGLLTTDAVFLGTDGSERWQGEEFRTFVSSHFSEGKGWTYLVEDRQVTLAADGNSAWFDETLDNQTLGRCRGSGVLALESGNWRIAQYNLSVPIPNSMIVSVAAGIRVLDEGAKLPVDSQKNAEDTASSIEIMLESTADIAADPATESSGEGSKKSCRKRFKTNTRADC
ncbi:MAG: nuclear transport factor 2 family protein [Gammaproteobacteria bacterium]|nr:nuclear transport factor 2 family protein [Gammaproteobacteria bacterium]